MSSNHNRTTKLPRGIFRPRKIITWTLVVARQFFPATHALQWFCGTDWSDAERNCHQPCPSGDSSECTTAGHGCYSYTGCVVAEAEDADGQGDDGDDIGFNDIGATNANSQCGTSWLEAMLSCSAPCGGGGGCPRGESCFAATNCDRPMEPIVSNMIMSLLGDYYPNVNLGMLERGVFEESVLEFLEQRMEEERVAINGADVTGQNFQGGGRRRRTRWNETIAVELNPDQRQRRGDRRLLSSSSALDVSMTITGEYRPPPYRDMDTILEDSLNRASQQLVKNFRTRGRRGGTDFFERVQGMETVSVARSTQRPTKEPTDLPTINPTSSPSRSAEQMVQTGTGADLYVGTARSFGNIFEVKTKRGSQTVVVKGLSFYTATPGRISYEVYSKEGSWSGYEGMLGSFEKVAEGRARTRGSCDESTRASCDEYFVRIPFDEFANVPIIGGGGSRSFYITLDTKVIMYSRGESSGTGGFNIQAETPDIEVYEGAGVLVYPFSLATEEYNYMKPRGFLGQIWYERNPCEDESKEWPCTTRSPALQLTSKLTQRPTTIPSRIPITSQEPTRSPFAQTLLTPSLLVTPSPAEQAVVPQWQNENSEAPSVSVALNELATTPSPSAVKISYDEAEVTSTNVVLTLHDVQNRPMDERESKKYSKLMLDFLRSQPSVASASVNVLNVTIWHQAIFVSEAEKKKKVQKRPAGPAYEKKRGKARKLLPAVNSVNSESRSHEESVPGLTDDGAGRSLEDTNSAKTGVSMDITTVIETANSVLPPDVTDVLLLHVIEEEKSALIDSFRAELLLSSYLNDISDVSGRIITDVTNPPSTAPMALSANGVGVQVMPGAEGDAGGRLDFMTLVGASIGLLWCILTGCGLCQVYQARKRMKNKQMLRAGCKEKDQSMKLNEDPSDLVSVFDVSGGTKPVDLVSIDEEEGSSIVDRDGDPAHSAATFAELISSGRSNNSKEDVRRTGKRQVPSGEGATSADFLLLVPGENESARGCETALSRSMTEPTRDRHPTAPRRLQSLYYEPTNQEEKKEGREESVKDPSMSLTMLNDAPARGSDSSGIQVGINAQEQAPYSHSEAKEIEASARDSGVNVNKFTTKRSRTAKKIKQSPPRTKRDMGEDGEESGRPSDRAQEVFARESNAAVIENTIKSSSNTLSASTTEKPSHRTPNGRAMVNASMSKSMSQSRKNRKSAADDPLESATMKSLVKNEAKHGDLNSSKKIKKSSSKSTKHNKKDTDKMVLSLLNDTVKGSNMPSDSFGLNENSRGRPERGAAALASLVEPHNNETRPRRRLAHTASLIEPRDNSGTRPRRRSLTKTASLIEPRDNRISSEGGAAVKAPMTKRKTLGKIPGNKDRGDNRQSVRSSNRHGKGSATKSSDTADEFGTNMVDLLFT